MIYTNYKVVVYDAGTKVASKDYDDYDEALEYAMGQNDSYNYKAVVLELSPSLDKYKKRTTLYPRESF